MDNFKLLPTSYLYLNNPGNVNSRVSEYNDRSFWTQLPKIKFYLVSAIESRRFDPFDLTN